MHEALIHSWDCLCPSVLLLHSIRYVLNAHTVMNIDLPCEQQLPVKQI